MLQPMLRERCDAGALPLVLSYTHARIGARYSHRLLESFWLRIPHTRMEQYTLGAVLSPLLVCSGNELLHRFFIIDALLPDRRGET